MLRATYLMALLATLSAAAYPSIHIACGACVLWSVHFYLYQERATLAGRGGTARLLIAGWALLLVAFYATFGGTLFALVCLVAVSLSMLMSLTLPKLFVNTAKQTSAG